MFRVINLPSLEYFTSTLLVMLVKIRMSGSAVQWFCSLEVTTIHGWEAGVQNVRKYMIFPNNFQEMKSDPGVVI